MTWSTRMVLARPLLGALLAVPTALSAQITSVPRPAPVQDSTKMTKPLGGYQPREGFWFGAGLGYGSLRGGNGPGIGGVTGLAEAGWSLSRRVLLGIGVSAWSRSGFDGETGRLGLAAGSLDLRVRWYPSEMAGGLFVTGAAGLGFIRLHDREARPTSVTHTGPALRAGLGYDFRLARGVSLTPFGTGSAIRTEHQGDHMAVDVWQLGLELTVH